MARYQGEWWAETQILSPHRLFKFPDIKTHFGEEAWPVHEKKWHHICHSSPNAPTPPGQQLNFLDFELELQFEILEAGKKHILQRTQAAKHTMVHT